MNKAQGLKVDDAPVKGAALEAKARLSSAQLAEVLSSFGHNITPQLHYFFSRVPFILDYQLYRLGLAMKYT